MSYVSVKREYDIDEVNTAFSHRNSDIMIEHRFKGDKSLLPTILHCAPIIHKIRSKCMLNSLNPNDRFKGNDAHG